MSRRGHNLRSGLTPQDRFWSKVRQVGRCWEWQARERVNGYGRFRPASYAPKVLAHRFAYELLCGPADGLHVLHHCDNPLCVNPVHLFLGTNDDNVADKVAKGRQSCLAGERNPNAKLAPADVAEVKRLRAGGASRKAVAERFGITTAMVTLITRGRAWRSLAA